MRIISLYLPHFFLQVEFGANSEIEDKPVVIGGFPHERKDVIDASPKAFEHGIQPGIPLRQAYSLCPEAVFLPLDEEHYQREFGGVSGLIAGLVPKYEARDIGEIFIEIPFDSWEADIAVEIREVIAERAGYSVNIACASTRYAAYAASRIARPDETMVIPKGKERTFLSKLPIDLLPISEKIHRKLELLGICTMGQLANLPREEMGLAFGAEGERMWDLSRGIDRSRVTPNKHRVILAEKLDFDLPVETIDQLLYGAEILLNRLAGQLEKRWQHCRRMTAQLDFGDSSLNVVIDFKLATSLANDMLRNLKQRLENVRFCGPVTRIEIRLENLGTERSSQLKLLDNLPRCSESLINAIKQLQEKYGSSVIKRPVRPKTFSRLPEEAFELVDFT